MTPPIKSIWLISEFNPARFIELITTKTKELIDTNTLSDISYKPVIENGRVKYTALVIGRPIKENCKIEGITAIWLLADNNELQFHERTCKKISDLMHVNIIPELQYVPITLNDQAIFTTLIIARKTK